MVDIEEVAQDVVNATIKVHRGLGLLESVYQLFIGNFAPSSLAVSSCHGMGINHYCPTHRLRLELSHDNSTRTHISC